MVGEELISHKEEIVDRVLIDTTVTAVVEAPLDRIDLGTWLRGLSDEEPTRSLLKGLEDAGVTFEQASAERTAVVAAHNALETPNYAKSVERAALAGI